MRVSALYKIYLILFGNLFVVSIQSAYAQFIQCQHIIPLELEYVNGIDVQPGDTICLEAGVRSSLYLGNMKGTIDQPLIVINKNGIVEFDCENSYGISIGNCQFLKLTGSGSSDEYGIQIKNVPTGSGIKIGNLSSDVEITRIEISNTLYTGITAKTDPTCSFEAVRDSFTMYNTKIHHNYIHDIGTEGMYIGNSFYSGVTLANCDTTVLPHLLDGVDIHHNIIENTGWDGIQLGCALYNSNIHHNQIYFDSQAERLYQMSGIMVNPGSSTDVYNNIIINGKGTGISMQSTGGQKIYNNLIVNAGQGYEMDDQITKQKFGIFSKYSSNVGNDSSYIICNNTIINPKSDGIRFQNGHSSDNLFQNNIIINPGAFDYYEENGNTSNTGMDSYIYVYYGDIDYFASNNISERSSKSLYFIDTLNYNYNISKVSPAVDLGTDLSDLGIHTDLNDQIRPFGTYFDIGAYENTDTFILPTLELDSSINIYPNPVENEINIETNNDSKILNIQIYNSYGEIIYNKKACSSVENINVSFLESGVYTIQFRLKDKSTVIKKLIKI